MLLLEGVSIKHYVQQRLLLNIPYLRVHQKDRIGLVGRNGSGKTTLLNMIAGELQPEEGQITHFSSVKLVPQLKRIDLIKSGGEITQSYLQQAFSHSAGLLLLDEPTTHLDTAHIEWLEKSLKDYQGAFMLVSHDRAFLDHLCTEIWEIDEGALTVFKGNYRDYTTQKELARKEQQNAYEKYEQQKRHLEEAIRKKEQRAQRATKKPKNLSGSEARLKGAKPYFANKQKKLRQTASAFETRLAQLEKVEKPVADKPIQMDVLNEATIQNQIIVRAEEVMGEIGKRTLWQPATFYIRGGDKVAIIGANGTGKTTLIKKLLARENIMISPSVQIGYFAQNLTMLEHKKSILENIQATSSKNEAFIRTVLARLHFYEEAVYKKVKVLSGGERVKVALAKIFLSDANLLVLDEPTNFLDIESLEALETLLQSYKGSVVFVSHDRTFIRNIATKIIEIKDQTLLIYDGNYEAYEAQLKKSEQQTDASQLLLIETKISDVLSRLSLEPSQKLEEEFEQLLIEKRRLLNK